MKVATHHYKQQMLLLIIIFMHVSIKVNRKSSNSSMEEIRQCRLVGDFFLKTIYHFTYNVGSAVSRAGTLS